MQRDQTPSGERLAALGATVSARLSPCGLADLLQIVIPLQGPHTVGLDVEAPILQISESYIESSP